MLLMLASSEFFLGLKNAIQKALPMEALLK
jgi:hypothetical protein